jgi:acetyl-CoA/propionyl-CoA carboxylase biotin carboxyl carrier protein
VTELVTGRDLLQAQLSVARCDGIGFAQSDVSARGVAVEARIYAEDPDAGFLPQAGDLWRVDLPNAPWLRVDSGVRAGDAISSHYDPMIAKVIAWGPDRVSAWTRLARALDATVVHGPVTNLDFLRELASRDDVVAGRYHTKSIEETFLPERADRLAARGDDLLLVAVALADRFGLSAGRDRAASTEPSSTSEPDPFRSLASWRHPGLGGLRS